MKYFFLLFLVGIASAASIYDASHDETDLLVASSYMEAAVIDDFDLADEGGDDLKDVVEKQMREKFEKILQKILDAIKKGQEVKDEYLEKVKELKEKLKEYKVTITEKARKLMDDIKERTREWLKKMLDKLGDKDNTEKRAIGETLKELFRKLKKALLGKLDKDAMKEKIEKLFGKGSEITQVLEDLIEKLKTKGEKAKQKILDFIDRVLGEKEDREERSLSEMWEKVKDYFEQIKIQIKEKYLKFGEWVKENLGKGLEHLKTKHEKIRKIAQEMKDHAKELSKEVIAEGLEFLRPYKEDLGSLYEQLKDVLKDMLKKKD